MPIFGKKTMAEIEVVVKGIPIKGKSFERRFSINIPDEYLEDCLSKLNNTIRDTIKQFEKGK